MNRPQGSFLEKAVKNYGGYHSATFGSLWKKPSSTVNTHYLDESTNPKVPSNITEDNVIDTGNQANETESRSVIFRSLWKKSCSTVTDDKSLKHLDELTNLKVPSNISEDNVKDTGNEVKETKSTCEVRSLQELCKAAYP